MLTLKSLTWVISAQRRLYEDSEPQRRGEDGGEVTPIRAAPLKETAAERPEPAEVRIALASEKRCLL